MPATARVRPDAAKSRMSFVPAEVPSLVQSSGWFSSTVWKKNSLSPETAEYGDNTFACNNWVPAAVPSVTQRSGALECDEASLNPKYNRDPAAALQDTLLVNGSDTIFVALPS